MKCCPGRQQKISIAFVWKIIKNKTNDSQGLREVRPTMQIQWGNTIDNFLSKNINRIEFGPEDSKHFA